MASGCGCATAARKTGDFLVGKHVKVIRRMSDFAVDEPRDANAQDRVVGDRADGQEHFDAMTKDEQDVTFGPDIAAALRSGKLQLTDLTTTKDGFLVRKPIDEVLP